MSRPYSMDLRDRAIARVLAGESVRSVAIEQVFAKLKHLLRKASERSHEATWRRIGDLLDAFPPHECANYLQNSGYGAV